MSDHDPIREEVTARLAKLVAAPTTLDPKVIFYQMGFAAARKERVGSTYRAFALAACMALFLSALVVPWAYRSGEQAAEKRASQLMSADQAIVIDEHVPQAARLNQDTQSVQPTFVLSSPSSSNDELMIAGVIGRASLKLTAVSNRGSDREMVSYSIPEKRKDNTQLRTSPLSREELNAMFNL